MNTVVSTLRKRTINDSIELHRKDAKIEELSLQIEALERDKPTPCALCRYAREGDNIAFLLCAKYLIRKGRDGYCDMGRPR